MGLITTFIRRQNQQGFNLIEAAIVLGIVGLILGGVFAAWGVVAGQQRIRKAYDMTTIIVQQVRSTYATRSSLDSVTGAVFTNALINAEIIPNEWIVNAGNLYNPWGGTVLITPETLSASAMNISFSQINKADCLKLANLILGAARTQGLTQIDSTTVTNTSNFTTIRGNVCSTGTLSLHFLLKSSG